MLPPAQRQPGQSSDFAHELQLRQLSQNAALQRQRRVSAISSAVIAVLSLVLMMIILAIFVLPAMLVETPQVVVYEQSGIQEETVDVKKINTSTQNKPSSPASSISRVIAATTSSPIAVPVPDLATTTPSMDFGDAEDFGDGWGNGTGNGNGGGTSFFGMKKATRSIVYVFDISGSMIMKPKNTKTYEVLENEIVKSIEMLGSDARFGLVGFSRGADAYKSNLVSATSFERRDATQWLKRMSPAPAAQKKYDFKNFRGGRHSGTRADLGIQMALKMKPETIIFVSDGEPTDAKGKSSKAYEQSVLKMVDALQKQQAAPVQINCIAYMTSGGLNFMRELAKRNRGEFRQIRPSDLK